MAGKNENQTIKTNRAEKKSFWRRKRFLLPASALCGSGLLYGWNGTAPMEPGLAFSGPVREALNVRFHSDTSWLDGTGQRHLEQSIFDEILRLIEASRQLVLIDMFLFNDWQGPVPETTRGLSGELTDALVRHKGLYPDIRMVVISDPINTVYGGTKSAHFDQMKEAGIEVVTTRLTELNDSNPVYSFVWRWLIRPWGNAPASTVPNPFGDGGVSVRSYLNMVNFKANHRKTLVVDNASGTYTALVTSANPHDGSSAHRNIAVTFEGAAATDLVRSENAVLALSDHAPVMVDALAGAARNKTESSPEPVAGPDTIQLLTERKIKDAILDRLSVMGAGDQVAMMMFYLADRDVIEALIASAARGADVRVILDVNNDAFGRQKNGVPNKPVAHELQRNGVTVRWCQTAGEQCHAKMLLLEDSSDDSMKSRGKTLYLLQGSANFTRRNLDNFNLETDILVTGSDTTEAIVAAKTHFETMWSDHPGKTFTVPYSEHADESLLKRWMYRVMEASGLSTF